MKGIKKLLTGILAATLIMGSCLTVCADEGTGSTSAADTSATITITPKATTVNEIKKGTVETITYTYYQILEASAPAGAVDKNTPISYFLKNDDKGNALKKLLTEGEGAKFTATLTADGSKWIMTSSETDGEAMRNALNTDAIKAAALSTGTFSYKDGTAKSGTLPIGYYLVESSLGSVVALQTVGHVEIEEKNDYITTKKTVAKTHYNVGDHVAYTAEVFIPDTTKVNTENDPSIVILHDKMHAKLAFDNNVTAKIGDAEFTGFTVAKDNLEDGCTFEVSIPVTEDLLKKTIVFSYTAELTSELADANGFVNELFGEYNGYKTEPSKPVVYTYGFNVDKEFLGYTGQEDFTATFEIRTSADKADTAISFVKIGNTLNYRKAHTGDTNTTTDVIVKNGKNKTVISNFYGLDEGTYYLVEKSTTAPGYNILTSPVAVTITADKDEATGDALATWTVSYTVNDEQVTPEDKTVVINNTKGTLLPSTGGIGTTIFYIIGGLLIVAGVAYFIVRRKASAE